MKSERQREEKAIRQRKDLEAHIRNSLAELQQLRMEEDVSKEIGTTPTISLSLSFSLSLFLFSLSSF
jgi:hypothetical protein